MMEKLRRYNSNKKELFEMANISKEKTGLPVMVWISYQTGKEKHSARIKIRLNDEWIPITISDKPEVKSKEIKGKSKVINSVIDWIVLNKNVLLKYWNAKGKLGIDFVLDNIMKGK